MTYLKYFANKLYLSTNFKLTKQSNLLDKDLFVCKSVKNKFLVILASYGYALSTNDSFPKRPSHAD